MFWKVSLHSQPGCREDNESLYLTAGFVHGLLLLRLGDSVQLQESEESGLRVLRATYSVNVLTQRMHFSNSTEILPSMGH